MIGQLNVETAIDRTPPPSGGDGGADQLTVQLSVITTEPPFGSPTSVGPETI